MYKAIIGLVIKGVPKTSEQSALTYLNNMALLSGYIENSYQSLKTVKTSKGEYVAFARILIEGPESATIDSAKITALKFLKKESDSSTIIRNSIVPNNIKIVKVVNTQQFDDIVPSQIYNEYIQNTSNDNSLFVLGAIFLLSMGDDYIDNTIYYDNYVDFNSQDYTDLNNYQDTNMDNYIENTDNNYSNDNSLDNSNDNISDTGSSDSSYDNISSDNSSYSDSGSSYDSGSCDSGGGGCD